MKKSRRQAARRFKAGAALVLVCAALVVLVPALSPLAQRAALFAAVLTMPEGSISTLENRFRDVLEPPLGQTPDSQPPSPSKAPQQEDDPTEPKNWIWPQDPSELFFPSQMPKVQPEIPTEYKGSLITEDLSGYGGGPFVQKNDMWLRNYTNFSSGELLEILKTPMNMKLGNTEAPQVLIYHTHATESFCPYDSDVYDKRYNWRSTDNNNNMVAVGAVLADTLRKNGIGVVQDTAQHDYPSYNGSYANSYNSVKQYLARYPSIKVVLDLHRDAIEREGGVIVKPTVELFGQKYAQIMIIANCDDGSGLIPHWRENLRFAAALSDRMERATPNLTRPILFSYRRYNQQLSPGALLLEFGSHANTLEEAKRSAVLAGEALAAVLKDTENRT